VLIGSVLPDSPAEKAGLKDGDIVTELNGKPVETVSQLRNGIASLSPKSKADLLIWRDRKSRHVQVVVGELAGSEAVSAARPGGQAESTDELGVTVVPLTRQLAEQIGFQGDLQGVVITEVDQGSVAERATLRPGDVIVSIGSTAIEDVNDYRDAIRQFDPQTGIRMQVVRDGIRRFVFVRSTK
jgi:serine protease Do